MLAMSTVSLQFVHIFVILYMTKPTIQFEKRKKLKIRNFSEIPDFSPRKIHIFRINPEIW